MRNFVSLWSLLAVCVLLTNCTKATQTQSSLGLSSASFTLRQDGQAPVSNALIVNKTTKLVTFDIVCETAHKDLQLSLDGGTTYASIHTIQCENGIDEIQLPLNALPGSIAPNDLAVAVIPFKMKAIADDFETEALSGYFAQPTFSGEFLILEGGSTTTTSLTILAEYIATLQAGSFLFQPKYVYFTNNSDCTTGGQWYPFSNGQKTDLILPHANAINYVYAKFKDYAGNESGCANSSITHHP